MVIEEFRFNVEHKAGLVVVTLGDSNPGLEVKVEYLDLVGEWLESCGERKALFTEDWASLIPEDIRLPTVLYIKGLVELTAKCSLGSS